MRPTLSLDDVLALSKKGHSDRSSSVMLQNTIHYDESRPDIGDTTLPRTTGRLRPHLTSQNCSRKLQLEIWEAMHHLLSVSLVLQSAFQLQPTFLLLELFSKWKLESIHVRASHLRRSSFQQLPQPLSAASEPPPHTAFAAPGASPGVLGRKGGVAGHCSQEGG